MSEIRWPETTGFKVGDTVVGDVPPPLTLLDRILWRLFRIERKRPLVRRTYIVTATSTASPSMSEDDE